MPLQLQIASGRGGAYTARVIRNIIFDWSGTLVDDLPAVWQATNYVLRRAGRPEMTLDEFRAEFCLPFKGFYDRHTPHVALRELEDWFHTSFREVQESAVELPHARAFLDFCRGRGMRMFVLSTIRQEYYVSHTASNGFDKYMERAYLQVWDKSERIHELLAENKLEPRETLYIGDMQHDIDTARHGGVWSCGVLTGYNTLPQLRQSEPDLIVEHLGELRQLLEKNDLEMPGKVHAGRIPIATVGALIRNREGKVLMVRTRKWSNLWGIPGGKIKFGESSVDGLRREIKEETNLEVSNIEFVLVQDAIFSKEFYRDEHFILLNYVCEAGESGEVKLNAEADEFRWVSLDEAMRMDLNTPTRVLLEAVLKREIKG